jgi:hypothetical protein
LRSTEPQQEGQDQEEARNEEPRLDKQRQGLHIDFLFNKLTGGYPATATPARRQTPVPRRKWRTERTCCPSARDCTLNIMCVIGLPLDFRVVLLMI